MGKNDKRYLDIIRETSYYLWQSLLTINSIYITLIIGYVTLTEDKSEILLWGTFITLIALSVSSFLLIWNFYSLKLGYMKIVSLSESDLENEAELVSSADEVFKKTLRNEKISLAILFLVTVLIISTPLLTQIF